MARPPAERGPRQTTRAKLGPRYQVSRPLVARSIRATLPGRNPMRSYPPKARGNNFK
jgi:hypothetical protein